MGNFIGEKTNGLPRPNYQYITNEADAWDAMSFIDRYPSYALDTETTSLDPYEAKLTLLQIGVPDKAFVFDMRYDTDHSSLHPEILNPILQDEKKIKIIQNSAYDMKILKVNIGYYLSNIYDTMLAEQLLNLGLFAKANLNALMLRYLGMSMPKEPRLTFSDYGQEYKPFQLEYAANDVVFLHDIRELQLKRLKAENQMHVLNLEFDFVVPMCEMELNGISLDVERWRGMMDVTKKECDVEKKAIHKMLENTEDQQTMFGVSLININSQKQLKEALIRCGLALENTSVGELSKYQGVPVIDSILEYRKSNKLISTYSESLLEKISKYTNRLHTGFRQMVSTGRLSSSGPNLQNIPHGQRFRSCFIAKEGYTLLTADMSGAELRILGNLSKDPVFLECFREGIDLHSRSASEIFGVPVEDVDLKMRKTCKALSFGLCVDEDTNIITDKGVVKIKDVNVGDTVAHDVGKDTIIDHKFMGEKEVFEVVSKFGYKLNLTGDHRLKVIDINGNYVDKKVIDIDIETDQLCLKLGSNIFSHELFCFDIFELKYNTNAKKFKQPKKLTSDWASFMGLLLSEGHFHKGKSGNYDGIQFGMSIKDTEFISYIDKLFVTLFGNYSRSNNKSIVSYSINGRNLVYWLVSIIPFDDGNKTSTIDIPECIKKSPKEIQIAFIRTLFEGDGTIFKKYATFGISYSSMSYKLVSSLQLMLLNFGIVSKLRETPDCRYPDNKYYKLDIIDTACKLKFMSEIGFITNRKNSKGITNKTFKRSFYNINYSESKLKDLQYKISIERSSINSKAINSCNWYLYNNLNLYNRYFIGNAYFELLSNYDKTIKFMYDNSIITLPIESIKKVGKKKVYDLSINNRELFLANGFIVHNCYGLSKFGLSKRLNISEKEAQELIDNYFNVFRFVKRYLDKSASDGVSKGYSESIAGRRRHYNKPAYDHPDKNKILRGIKRQAMNMPIQSCLIAGTKISGLGNIEDYVGKKIELETGFGKDYAVGVYSGKRDVYDLKLSNGSVIGITDDHTIPVITPTGPAEKFVKNLDFDNDYLLVPLTTINGKITELSDYTYDTKGSTYVEFPTPKYLIPELSFIIGCLVGDGNYSNNNHIRFCSSENQVEVLYKFNKCIEKIFKYIPITKEVFKKGYISPLITSQVSSVFIRGFLKYVGLDYVTARDKSIPKYFHTETIENKGALLNGLFSTDGGMTYESGPNYTTVSEGLANDIHMLLFSLGINSNLKTYKEENSLVYRIQIPKRFNKKFKELIGFSVDIKNNKLNDNLSIPKNGGGSLVPDYISKIIAHDLVHSGVYSTLSINDKAHIRQFKKGRSSFHSWRKFYDKMENTDDKNSLEKYLNFDFCKPMSLIYRGKEDVYDLMCDNIHYFIANGVVVHNSNADTIKKAMIYIVKRLAEKNLPAKLILTVHDEVVVEVKKGFVDEVAVIVEQSMKDGFGDYFTDIPMETDVLEGPCWLKGSCENKIDGKLCRNKKMVFVKDKNGVDCLICNKCGALQE